MHQLVNPDHGLKEGSTKISKFIVSWEKLKLENWNNGKVSEYFLEDTDKEDNKYLVYFQVVASFSQIPFP